MEHHIEIANTEEWKIFVVSNSDAMKAEMTNSYSTVKILLCKEEAHQKH